MNKSYELARLRAAESGELPLDYMLRLMRSPRTPFLVRIDLAKAAAPYLHGRLQAVTHSGDPNSPLETVTRIERVIIEATECEDAAAESPQHLNDFPQRLVS